VPRKQLRYDFVQFVAFRRANPTGRQLSRPRRTPRSLPRWSLGNSLWWLIRWSWCVSCLLSAWTWVRLAYLYLSAPLYLRTLWRYTNAVIIMISLPLRWMKL